MKAYLQLAHAIQSAIAFRIQAGSQEATPKHLRTGLDLSKAEQGGLVELLISKGVFTSEEYIEAMTKSLEKELEMQTNIAQKFGAPQGVVFE